MRRHLVPSLFVLAVLTCGLAFAPHAEAKRQAQVRYPFERVWNATLRMVRVDMRMPITDRDPEAGYMLFEYRDGDRRYPGSFEVIADEQDGRPLVTIIASVQGMPSYVEIMLLDKLEKKLGDEYGAPMQPPAKRPREDKPEDKPEGEPSELPPAEPAPG